MKSKDSNYTAIGARIRKIRRQQNMTQETLAEKAGICSGQQVSAIERGQCGLSVSKLIDICRALDTDADYLLFGTSTRNSDTPMNKYLSQLTAEQSQHVEELISTLSILQN